MRVPRRAPPSVAWISNFNRALPLLWAWAGRESTPVRRIRLVEVRQRLDACRPRSDPLRDELGQFRIGLAEADPLAVRDVGIEHEIGSAEGVAPQVIALQLPLE